jgi:hypothetical protein
MLYTEWREVLVDVDRVEGMILGVIGLLFLLYPVVWSFYRIIVPPPLSEYDYRPCFAGAFMGMLLLNIPGVIFVGLSKSRLKRSTVFGALFIAAGLLNFYFWSGTLCFSGLSNLLVNAPSIITILIGVSLIVPLRQAAR